CGLWLLACLLTWACQPPGNDRTLQPDNLIPADKMAQILTEVHLAESRVSKLGLSASDSSAMVYKRLERQIHKKLNVDTAAYNRSYTYYAANPAKLEAIYKEVVKNLEQKITPPQKLTRS
ncbi:MAG: DUF4296 domain-containing protein, partial [Bacteroidetes bacterium]|nr:DUF4296 domain-containing protein [Fibrella sp.]